MYPMHPMHVAAAQQQARIQSMMYQQQIANARPQQFQRPQQQQHPAGQSPGHPAASYATNALNSTPGQPKPTTSSTSTPSSHQWPASPKAPGSEDTVKIPSPTVASKPHTQIETPKKVVVVKKKTVSSTKPKLATKSTPSRPKPKPKSSLSLIPKQTTPDQRVRSKIGAQKSTTPITAEPVSTAPAAVDTPVATRVQISASSPLAHDGGGGVRQVRRRSSSLLETIVSSPVNPVNILRDMAAATGLLNLFRGGASGSPSRNEQEKARHS